MPMNRLRAGLLGLLGLGALPGAALGWPSDSGPSGDFLGGTVRQFDRLSPPPVERDAAVERAVPGLSATDLPGRVDVGAPVIAPPPPARARRGARPDAPRRAAAARTPGREDRLRRQLADQDRRIQELERRLEQRAPR